MNVTIKMLNGPDKAKEKEFVTATMNVSTNCRQWEQCWYTEIERERRNI